jgi:hypothetical protein
MKSVEMEFTRDELVLISNGFVSYFDGVPNMMNYFKKEYALWKRIEEQIIKMED